MPATDLDPLPVQQIPQHPAAREGELEVQLVHPTHDGEIGRCYGSGQGGDAAAADPERPCLLGDRQIVVAVDHRFALSSPALPSAPDKQSLVTVSSPTSHEAPSRRRPAQPTAAPNRTPRQPLPGAGPSRP